MAFQRLKVLAGAIDLSDDDDPAPATTTTQPTASQPSLRRRKDNIARGERRCRRILRKRYRDKSLFTLGDLEKVLAKECFPKQSGQRVRKGYGTGHEEKFILGLVRVRDKRLMSITRHTKERKRLTQLVNQIFKDTCPAGSTFSYSSVTILRNASCDWHRDGNNAGPTWMVGVGDYTQGELAVMEDDVEKKLDCKYQWIVFNGKTTLHKSCERSLPTQTRYTLQFYEHGELRNVQRRPSFEAMKKTLRKCFFPTVVDTGICSHTDA